MHAMHYIYKRDYDECGRHSSVNIPTQASYRLTSERPFAVESFILETSYNPSRSIRWVFSHGI